jgi:hypothetical protein
MALRGGGCFTPAAFLFTIGCLLIVVGSMAETARTIRYGVLCLVGAVGFVAAAIYARWQGWE